MATTQTPSLQLSTLADLQAAPVLADLVVFISGKLTPGDGYGGFYRWDAASTAAVDNTYLNVVQSTGRSTGRWLRVFVRNYAIPNGVVILTGLTKEYLATGVTDSNSRCTWYLTDDGTANGNALFTNVLVNRSQILAGAPNISDTVVGDIYSISGDLKTVVHKFTKPQVSVLGLLPLALVGAGVSVSVQVKGM